MVSPDQALEVKVSFKPTFENSYNFNISCLIQNKKDPLLINIKGIGYKINHQVLLEGQSVQQFFKNEINFGQIYSLEKKAKRISIVNEGNFNFEFILKYKKHPSILIKQEQGTTKVKETVNLEIEFAP